VGALITVLALVAVTACGAGQVAQTAEMQTHAGGAVARAGEIALLDVRFPFVGPIPGDEVYPVGADAALRGTIVNSGDRTDRLRQIVSPIAGSAVLSGPVEVPPGGTLLMGWAGPPSPPGFPPDTRSYVGLAELTTPLRSGQSYPVEFRFELAGPVLVHVPIATPDQPRD
jgi:copper(I)-binding protein